MTGASRQFGKAERLQLAANRRLVQGDAEFPEYPLHQVLASPANNPVDGRDRATLDHLCKSYPLAVVQFRAAAGRFSIHQSIKAAGVKAQNPISNDLQRNGADPCGLGTRAAVINGGKGQQAASLVCILRLAGKVTKTTSIKTIAQ